MPTSYQLRITAAASATLTMGVMPVFLVGALSGDIGDDMGFGSAGAGLAITIFFASGALTAVIMGGVTERIGATSAMRLGVTMSAVVLLALGTVADAWWHLAALLAVGGSAIGLIDTGGARSFADAIRAERHGTAFGAKEASVPAASMLAGLSIPLLVQRFGWSSAFVVGAGMAALVLFVVPPQLRGGRPPAAPAASDQPDNRGGLVLFAVGVAAGSAASSAAATLFVPAVTDDGTWSAGAAGTLLAVASVVSVIARFALGWSSDKAPSATWLMLTGSLALGAVGAGMLIIGEAAVLVVVGAVLVLGAGWGWSGLAFLSAVRARPHAPAVAAGIVLTGLATGGAGGPALFGVIADRWSYSLAWTACAVALVIASLLAIATRESYRPREVDIER